MTNEQNPGVDPNARADNTPPSQSSSSIARSPSTRTAVELPGGIPERSSAAASNSQQQNASSQEASRKPEGSSYASSYRPSAPGTSPPGQTVYAHYASNHDIPVTDEPDRTHPPPAYTDLPGQINDDSHELGANAIVGHDGRVNIRINQKSQRLSRLLGPQLQRQITSAERDRAPPPPYIPEFLGGAPGQTPPPPLNVVIHVVGSRGDVQPFIALGKVLKETYKHRVRLATHPVFKDFVTENGLEFFSIGGDPAELMAFMVKNPGLMPGFDTLRSGDVGKRRKEINEILRGTWRSCIETGDGLGVDPLKQTVEEWMGVEDGLPDSLKKPFVADAIIANPPSFGHIHCAEKLGIPLHMMFTMPWSPTQQFPHPLANIQSTNCDPNLTNYMSYALVDMLTWQGLGDLINRFRKDSLGLDPVSTVWAPNMLARMKLPFTYCWSPALIPKPKDWGPHISISGFYFLDMASNFTPEPALAEYLAAGEPPIYIGFGSIVVDDPNAMTQMIFEAVKKTGRRALVSKGWGGLGAEELGIPDGVFMLGNVPHDWLFKHVAAVVHHGGAGTTAAGIRAGKPTVIVPFFGDQPFWGAMTAKAGAGPLPIPYKDLTADKLAGAIEEALKPESLDRAQELANMITHEQGCHNGAQSFHQMLKYDDVRCMVAPENVAVWRVRRTQVRLSAKAASVLVRKGELTFEELKLFRPREYETDEGPWDPISGGATAIIGTATQMMMGVADFPIETLKLLNIHPDSGGTNKAKTSKGGSDSPKAPTRSTTQTSGVSNLPGSSTLDGSTAVGSPTTAQPASPSRHGSTTATPSLPTPTSPGTPSRRPSFMSQAMATINRTSRSPSPSRDRPNRPHSQTFSSTDARSETGSTFADRLHNMNAEAALSTGKGVGRIVGASFKSPMDFSLNVAKGFHNVPKLYGGEVRQVDKVTDFQSGVKTAAKEFGLGMFEGISGLVMDPYKGAKKEGGVGFIKGVAQGIAGVPLKVMGGVFSVPGYAMKGLYQEALKSKGANVQNYIIAARIQQGADEAQNMSRPEREGLVKRWRDIKLTVKKKKNPGEEQIEALHKVMKEKRAKKRERWAKLVGEHLKRPEVGPFHPQGSNERSSSSSGQSSTAARATTPIVPPRSPFRQASAFSHQAPTIASPNHDPPQQQPHRITMEDEEEAAERRDLESAIRASISDTSRGDPDEDEMIAQAIRASIAELERPASRDEDDEETLQRALKASLQEASKHGASEEEQRALEETLRRSLVDTAPGKTKRSGEGSESDNEWDSDTDEGDTEDDEVYRKIIAESKHMHSKEAAVVEAEPEADKRTAASADTTHDEDSHFQKALEESERVERERMEALQKQKSEEEIVMEYVKKQSLAEEEDRKRLAQGRDNGGGSSQ